MQKQQSQNQNLPKGWQKVKLGEIKADKKFAIVDGPFGTQLHANDYIKTGIPLFRVNNLSYEGKFVEDDLVYISEQKFQELKRSATYPGDILIAKTGATIGKLALFPKNYSKGLVASSCLKISVDPKKADYRYVFYFLMSRAGQSQIKNLAGGSTRDTINLDPFNKIEILMPSDIKIQKRIADILSAFDDKIELNNKINKTLEEMAQAIFKHWFVDFKFPGYEKTKFVNSELGKIPEGWKIKTLGDILSLEYGESLTSINRQKGDIPVYGSSGLVGYHNKKLVDGPGIIIGRAGIPGSIHWSQTDFFCVDSTFYVESTINKYFLFFLLKRQNLKSLISGSAVPGINRNIIYSNKIILPSPQIINDFSKVISIIFLKIYQNKSENQKLAELRDLLLPKLMNGEIRV